jgi:hypothetical protein
MYSDSSSSDEAPPPPKKEPRARKPQKPQDLHVKAPPGSDAEVKPKKVYQRLPNDKRQEIISLKERGIEDPEYQATRSPAGRWTVKKRKFPLDQSPHLDTTAGTAPIRVTPGAFRAPPPEAAPAPAPPPPAPEPKKDNLDLNWINMQTHVNDSLKRDLELLSEKYDKLAQKEEKRKKAKAKMAQVMARPPPQAPPPQPQAPPARAPVQPRPGLYHRADKLSIGQFS